MVKEDLDLVDQSVLYCVKPLNIDIFIKNIFVISLNLYINHQETCSSTTFRFLPVISIRLFSLKNYWKSWRTKVNHSVYIDCSTRFRTCAHDARGKTIYFNRKTKLVCILCSILKYRCDICLSYVFCSLLYG